MAKFIDEIQLRYKDDKELVLEIVALLPNIGILIRFTVIFKYDHDYGDYILSKDSIINNEYVNDKDYQYILKYQKELIEWSQIYLNDKLTRTQTTIMDINAKNIGENKYLITLHFRNGLYYKLKIKKEDLKEWYICEFMGGAEPYGDFIYQNQDKILKKILFHKNVRVKLLVMH
jgi:hypothetical protein